MRNEAEVRDKITYYQGMLTAIRMGCSIVSPRVFVALSQHFPEEAMKTLQLSQEIDEGMLRLPPEDRRVFRRAIEQSGGFLQEMLEEKIANLRWVLEEEHSDPADGGG